MSSAHQAVRWKFLPTNKAKVQHIFRAASHICSIIGAVRHRRGRRSAKTTAQARTHGL